MKSLSGGSDPRITAAGDIYPKSEANGITQEDLLKHQTYSRTVVSWTYSRYSRLLELVGPDN